MTKKFDLMKKMLSGSTTMPMTTNMGTPSNAHVHYHDGVACTHDHSKDHGHAGHVHDENCNHGHDGHVHDENCNHDHSKD